MASSKVSQLSVLALAFISPALACVQYSCNLNFDNGLFNAALTDNGGQTCQISNVYVGEIITADTPIVSLSCIAGYAAAFDPKTGVVYYKYGSFDGSFGTTTQFYDSDLSGVYWTANTWGC